jgi:hypothetical protein
MGLMLELSPELEARLQEEATRLGMAPEDLAAQILEDRFRGEKIGAQIVAEWERAGVIGSRPEITDSQAHARMLRERAQARERD